jgi:dienelactone hydrolase
VISVGRSAGGFASVALAADPPPGLVAVVSFAGGRGSLADGEVCNQDALVRAFGQFGATARVPMLWVYARNDQYFGPDLAQALHRAFTASGGKAELIQAPDFGEDGHTLFSRQGIPVWTPYVDAFLGRLGLVSGTPPPAPARAQASPPGALSANGRKAFAAYLEAPGHKAFAMSAKGSFSWRSGRRTPEEAAQEAREACAEHAETSCRVVMLDDVAQ